MRRGRETSCIELHLIAPCSRETKVTKDRNSRRDRFLLETASSESETTAITQRLAIKCRDNVIFYHVMRNISCAGRNFFHSIVICRFEPYTSIASQVDRGTSECYPGNQEDQVLCGTKKISAGSETVRRSWCNRAIQSGSSEHDGAHQGESVISVTFHFISSPSPFSHSCDLSNLSSWSPSSVGNSRDYFTMENLWKFPFYNGKVNSLVCSCLLPNRSIHGT